MRAHMWLLYTALGICVLIAHYVLFLLIRCEPRPPLSRVW